MTPGDEGGEEGSEGDRLFGSSLMITGSCIKAVVIRKVNCVDASVDRPVRRTSIS